MDYALYALDRLNEAEYIAKYFEVFSVDNKSFYVIIEYYNSYTLEDQIL
jgi:hypothetical protein